MTPEERDEYVRKLREERKKNKRLKKNEYTRQWAKERRRRYPTFSSENYRKYKGWHRTNSLRKNYNITAEDYAIMLAAQGGCCAVPTCRADKPGGNRSYFCVDHDHATGIIRGLTCHKCNIILHSGRDNKEFLLGLIEYLEKAR